MKIIMNDADVQTIAQIEQFLSSSSAFKFESITQEEAYVWVNKTLTSFAYHASGRHDKGILQRYIRQMTGYSRQQVARLIKQHKTTGQLISRSTNRYIFSNKYTEDDLKLLVETDNIHERLSGPVTKKLFERAYDVFNDARYQRLSNISSAHIYNLRETQPYRDMALTIKNTKAVKNSIGIRKSPEPEGRPGYLRIDTVHQGDKAKKKGVYHVNAVDEVTQMCVVVSVGKIDKEHMIVVLKKIIEYFPFKIIEIHADNGGEYINYLVAELLEGLFIQLTKSRPRHSNDNALVECKNGWVIRKHLGYNYIDPKHAARLNIFHDDYFIPYLNYHRPCYFSVMEFDKKGKWGKRYRAENIMTPYEKLKSLDNAEQYLKPRATFSELDKLAYAQSDEESAKRLQEEKTKLWKEISE